MTAKPPAAPMAKRTAAMTQAWTGILMTNRIGPPQPNLHKTRSEEIGQPPVLQWLLSAKARGVIRSPHSWTILALILALGYVYYNVLTGFYDVYVVLFAYPAMYAAVVFRLRGVLASSLLFLAILLPRELLFASDPYSLARSLLFSSLGFLVSGLTATLLNYLEKEVVAYRKIRSLNQELNISLDCLESAHKQLVQAEKLNALGQLAASIAHEVNNPLAGALVYTKLITKRIASGSFEQAEMLKNLAKIEEAVGHTSEMVKGLLDFARQSPPTLRPVGISDVLDKVLSLAGHQAQMKNVQVVKDDLSRVPLVMADSDQLVSVFLNLVLNAVQAMPEGGTLSLHGSMANDGLVEIGVQDTGVGIAPENLGKLFTPFFTTKEKGKGSGLGLAVSHGIVERHGGTIEVQSQPGQGSTFTVRLPVYESEK